MKETFKLTTEEQLQVLMIENQQLQIDVQAEKLASTKARLADVKLNVLGAAVKRFGIMADEYTYFQDVFEFRPNEEKKDAVQTT